MRRRSRARRPCRASTCRMRRQLRNCRGNTRETPIASRRKNIKRTEGKPEGTAATGASAGKVRQAGAAREGKRLAGPQLLRRPGFLAVHSVEKSFGSRQVVRGVSVYVRRGEAVGLLGPNGAGKTTVFYMITGLIKADRGADRARPPRRHEIADVPARAARHRLCAARSLDLPRAHRRAEYPRGARSRSNPPGRSARRNSIRCSVNSTSRASGKPRRLRFPAASAAASK